MNKLRNFKIIEDPPIKIDLYIEGMEPVKGVQIEITGRRSYELNIEGESEKDIKKRKYQLALVVDVFQEGFKKVVSFESQVIMTNKTDHCIEIAHVLLTQYNRGLDEMEGEDITQAIQDYQDLDLVDPNFKHLINFDQLEIFDTVKVEEEYRIPFKWFLLDVAIFFKSTIDRFSTYNLLIPDIKNTFLKKGRATYDFSEKVQKYHFQSKEDKEIRMIAMEVVVNKCKPTTLNRPPQYNWVIRPPFTFVNMLFSQIAIRRAEDQEVIETVEPGESANIYAIPYNIWTKNVKKGCWSNKLAGRLNKYKDEIKPNMYEFEFYDGKSWYKTEPQYFLTKTQELDFECQDGISEIKMILTEEQMEMYENKITITFEAYNFNILVYTPYMLINKTKLNLVFGQKGKNKNKDDLIWIKKFTSEYFHPKKREGQKFSLKTDGYKWSKPFNCSTFGISGLASMKRLKDDEGGHDNDELVEKYNTDNIDIGVIIATMDPPFGKTKTISFLPRYIIVNNSGVNLVIAQDK